MVRDWSCLWLVFVFCLESCLFSCCLPARFVWCLIGLFLPSISHIICPKNAHRGGRGHEGRDWGSPSNPNLFCLVLSSRLVLSCHVLPCLSCVNLSCLVCLLALSCLAVSCLTRIVLSYVTLLSCVTSTCLVLSCVTLSCLVLPCLVLPCLVLSCLVLSRLVLSCLVLFCFFMSLVLFLVLSFFLRDLMLPRESIAVPTSHLTRRFRVS